MSAGRLHRVSQGEGEPIVLVHGSWTDHTTWAAVQPILASTHRAVAYDRRGHSRSGPADGLGSRRVHEDDLIALVEELDVGPVHLVGNSFGGTLALAVAARRPDLVRSVTAHEPPLVDVGTGDAAAAALLAPVLAASADIERTLRSGDARTAARRFVEEVALGPGAWDLLPGPARDVMVANAATFVEMLDGDAWGAGPVVPADGPMQLAVGNAGPAWFVAVARAVAAAHPHAAWQVVDGAGHVPHATHAEVYAAAVVAWVTGAAQVAAVGRR